MEPLQIQCSHCQKNYLVAAHTLTFGEARFQCTSCQSLFAINWTPQALEVAQTETQKNGHLSTYLIEKFRKPKTCGKCSYSCFEDDTECPKCGVVFKKIESAPVIRINSKIPELSKMWENVRKNYHEDSFHVDFIKACGAHDQLVFASQQYKSILIVNPSEPTAQRMQKVLIELIDSKKELSASKLDESEKPKIDVFKTLLFVCGGCFLIGAVTPGLRPLIALSSSVLFFMMAYKYWVSEN